MESNHEFTLVLFVQNYSFDFFVKYSYQSIIALLSFRRFPWKSLKAAPSVLLINLGNRSSEVNAICKLISFLLCKNQ